MKDWARGFFEANATFSIGINLLKSKNKRWVALKPCVVLHSKDNSKLVAIVKDLNLNINISVPKSAIRSGNPTFSINIQRWEDIDEIVRAFKEKSFRSTSRKLSFNTFVTAYELVKKIGYLHTEWSEEMERVIRLKRLINASMRTRPGYDENTWKKRILEHFNSKTGGE